MLKVDQTAYIEIVAELATARVDLQPYDLWNIGEFTRENIASWLDRSGPIGLGLWSFGYEDFHAVCGDIDIPWAIRKVAV